MVETKEEGERLRLVGAPALRHAPMGKYPVLVLLMRFSNDTKTALSTRAQIQTLYKGERNINPAVPLAMDAGIGIAGALDVTATVTP